MKLILVLIGLLSLCSSAGSDPLMAGEGRSALMVRLGGDFTNYKLTFEGQNIEDLSAGQPWIEFTGMFAAAPKVSILGGLSWSSAGGRETWLTLSQNLGIERVGGDRSGTNIRLSAGVIMWLK